MNKRKMCIAIIIGTRPNFIKVTQFKRVAREQFSHLEIQLIHTGQHYDQRMAHVFFDQFGLRPDILLNIEPGHPAKQIASIIDKLSAQFLDDRPNLVVVVGDVNSTLAAAVAANKCDLPLAHLESGLRSGDMNMPEEHNRCVADLLSNLHFITEESGLLNLRSEGKREAGLAFVGNTMIDTLVAYRSEIDQSKVLETFDLTDNKYVLTTLHRPSNVDTPEGLQTVLEIFRALSRVWKIVFPIHPRTKASLESFGLFEELTSISGMVTCPPLGYFDFQRLIGGCAFVLTDSGGIQEETTFLKKPCLTLRPNTERPSTIEIGSNILLEFDVDAILAKTEEIRQGVYKQGAVPKLWDGMATARVLQRINDYFDQGF